ncbi:MAG: STAS domain-containing protein [Planctomycetes bacterium]|jgi:anti-anti-sigma factor|nr:STAS domain-containing protein [Planctomycetota bacterium]
MSEEPEVVQVVDRSGVKLVRIRPSAILREVEVESFGDGLLALAEVPGQRVVLSFLGVQHLTSLVLGKLIHVHKRLAESGGELRLADIDPHIYEVFAITHLDRLFRIFDREDEAVASFIAEAEA